MASMKAKSDEKAERLCQEISMMKAAKVSLLKRMKEESMKYRYGVCPEGISSPFSTESRVVLIPHSAPA